MLQIFLTALVTIIGGVIIFVIGQLVVILFIERIRVQARSIEEVAQALVMFAREYSTPVQRTQALSEVHEQRLLYAQTELRRLSATLRATTQALKWYPIFELLKLVLTKENVTNASRSLIGLSNCVPPSEDLINASIVFRREIETYLGFVDPIEENPIIG